MHVYSIHTSGFSFSVKRYLYSGLPVFLIHGLKISTSLWNFIKLFEEVENMEESDENELALRAKHI